jgi:hypothetical protein
MAGKPGGRCAHASRRVVARLSAGPGHTGGREKKRLRTPKKMPRRHATGLCARRRLRPDPTVVPWFRAAARWCRGFHKSNGQAGEAIWAKVWFCGRARKHRQQKPRAICTLLITSAP